MATVSVRGEAVIETELGARFSMTDPVLTI
jgi:hypothetical protein